MRTELIPYNNSDTILQTVAMPCYNAKNIGWLVMEGLSNQVCVDWDWELIVCEEKHEKQLGIEFFKGYIEKLKTVGCKRLLYIELEDYTSLINKWQIIGKESTISSKSFLLQTSDCYSSGYRLFLSHYAIQNNYDWVDFTKGYFYSFLLDKMILYDCQGMRNLSMAFKTEFARQIPDSDKRKGIDSFMFRSFEKIKGKSLNVKRINVLCEDSLDTDGFNNITNRNEYYENPVSPFTNTDKTIDTISLPTYIKDWIKEKRQKKSVSILIPAYNSQSFIEECLDSINIQNYFVNNDKFEVLVGVDGCSATLAYLLSIKKRYRNLKIYWMAENKGTYMTLNALLDKVQYDNIIIFGSDDIMLPDMVKTLVNQEADLIQSKFFVLNSNVQMKSYSCGAIWIKKKVFDLAGGYEPWQIAADRDLLNRVQNKIKIKQIPDQLFYYRKHFDSMTNQYGKQSSLRIQLHQKSENNIKKGIVKIERISNIITNEY
jgi:hypothetical protein